MATLTRARTTQETASDDAALQENVPSPFPRDAIGQRPRQAESTETAKPEREALLVDVGSNDAEAGPSQANGTTTQTSVETRRVRKIVPTLLANDLTTPCYSARSYHPSCLCSAPVLPHSVTCSKMPFPSFTRPTPLGSPRPHPPLHPLSRDSWMVSATLQTGA